LPTVLLVTHPTIDNQRLYFEGKALELDGPPLASLSSYGIRKGSTIYVALRMRGGGDQPMAYAVVLHSWSGNMGVRFHISECNKSLFD
jgi:hypothetical protein